MHDSGQKHDTDVSSAGRVHPLIAGRLRATPKDRRVGK